MHKLSNNIIIVVLKLFFSTALAVFVFITISIFGFTKKAEAIPTCTNGISDSKYGVYGAAQFAPPTVTITPDDSVAITLDSIICNASDHDVTDTNYFHSKGYVDGKEALTITGGTEAVGWIKDYRQQTTTVPAHSSQHLYFSAILKGRAPDGTPIFSGSGRYTISISGFGYVLDKSTNEGSYTNVVDTYFGINIVVPRGRIQITKYGPNGQSYFADGRFKMCVLNRSDICAGLNQGSSSNVAVDPGWYSVLKANTNGPPSDGWYIDHVQLGSPNGNKIDPISPLGTVLYPFTVTSNSQAWVDVYLEKYAAQCGTSNIFSFNGSTTTPKAGDKFAMNFGMTNPGGITNWAWPTTKLHVKVPEGVTPIQKLNGQTVSSFDWYEKTRDLYIAPPSYNTIKSGQTINYTGFFQYNAEAKPGNYTYQYNMVFPDNSTAWIEYQKNGNTTFIPNCNGTSQLVSPIFYPWLQTKNGDVLARGTVIGQEFSKPGSRSDTSFGSELDYLLLSPGQNSSPAAKQFCSLNRYVLGRDMSKQCSAGLYDFTQQDFEDIQKAVSKTWERNGAGAGGSCIPYKTSTGNLPSGNISPGCAGGTMYKKIGNTNLSSFVSGSGAQSVSLGRATVWVTGKLTIDRDIINSYSSVTAGGSAPNLAFFVEGDVEIAPGVSQVDAIIISFPGRIKTCSQYPNPSCQSKLIANGYWAASLGFQFGRNYFDTTNPNANPAEQVILTGQSVVFPPPGLSRSDGDIESQLKYFDGELPPRLN